jgi:hypothetical protein
MSTVPVHVRLMQEDHKFQISLAFRASLCPPQKEIVIEKVPYLLQGTS